MMVSLKRVSPGKSNSDFKIEEVFLDRSAIKRIVYDSKFSGQVSENLGSPQSVCLVTVLLGNTIEKIHILGTAHEILNAIPAREASEAKKGGMLYG